MLKIDENRLIQELYYQRKAFKYGVPDIIKTDYRSFTALNNILANITGKMFPSYGTFYNAKETKMMLDKHIDKQLFKFLTATNENENNILTILDNFSSILEEVEYNCIYYILKTRKYSEKDFIDIIYSYYSTFGNKIYNIVKKYFEEERIHLGSDLHFDNDYNGFFTRLIYLCCGYIVVDQDEYDTRTLCCLTHELGHAIDAELFRFPQQKKGTSLSDMFIEVPSTFFELGMYDYLRKNKIDDRGSLLMYNNRFQMMLSSNERLKEVSKEDAYVQTDGTAIVTKDVTYDLSELEQDENGNIIIGDYIVPLDKLEYDDNGKVKAQQILEFPFRDDVIYSMGYYMALHLNLIKENDNKEALKIFNNIITSRNEASFEDLISKTGIPIDDYISGTFIKDKVQDEVLTLKRRYKVY